MEEVILVDENDNEIGRGEKMQVHREGKLHRCFSIFIFNSKGEVMLQQRARVKYHNGGMWSNACCGHPRPGEGTEAAAHRRLMEENGFDCELKEVFSFIYKAKFEKDDLYEHEVDHVFIGEYDGEPVLNPEEADDWKWINMEELKKELEEHPEEYYTFWLRIAFKKLVEYLEKNKRKK